MASSFAGLSAAGNAELHANNNDTTILVEGMGKTISGNIWKYAS
jgi:hypothetical protein